MPDPRPRRQVDEDYLDHVRAQPCLICAAPSPSDPHHLDSGVTGGKGSDWTCIPMCRQHHREYHAVGHRKMEDRHHVDLWRHAHRLLRRYFATRQQEI